MRLVWPLAPRHVFDALVVIAAAGSALLVALDRESSQAPRSSLWFAVPATALVALPLLARRRLPLAAPLAVWLLATAFSLVDGRLIGFSPGLYLVGIAAALLLGNLADTMQARLSLAAVIGGGAIIVYETPGHSRAALVFSPLVFGLGWLAGFALRERAEQAEAAEVRAAQAEHERELAARVAVAEERARIARELHDVVAHSVSVMVLQVGAVRHGLPDELGEDREALGDVERTGRSALVEMRRLLGAMRSESDDLELTPQPGLGSLEPLLEKVRRAGLPVELHVDGDPFPLPDAIDRSAYRIVQEGLTNALKHAQASRVDVLVRYRPDELRIDVHDDGRGPAPGDGAGHGLIGIRERVKLYGGHVSAGAANGRGFLLSTSLPLGGAER